MQTQILSMEKPLLNRQHLDAHNIQERYCPIHSSFSFYAGSFHIMVSFPCLSTQAWLCCLLDKWGSTLYTPNISSTGVKFLDNLEHILTQQPCRQFFPSLRVHGISALFPRWLIHKQNFIYLFYVTAVIEFLWNTIIIFEYHASGNELQES